MENEKERELFIGIESSNMENFRSKCCDAALSLEPPCKICCGYCGREMNQKEDIYFCNCLMIDSWWCARAKNESFLFCNCKCHRIRRN